MTLRNVVGAEVFDEQQLHVIARDVLIKAREYCETPEVQVNVLWILVILMTNRKSVKIHIDSLGALLHIFRAIESYPYE